MDVNINHLSYKRKIIESEPKPYIQLTVQYGDDKYVGKLGQEFLLSPLREIVKYARINEIAVDDAIKHELTIFCYCSDDDDEPQLTPFCSLSRAPRVFADYDTLSLIYKVVNSSDVNSNFMNFRLLMSKLGLTDRFLYESCLVGEPDKLKKNIITFLMKIRIIRMLKGVPVWQFSIGESQKYDNDSLIAEYINAIATPNDAKILISELDAYLNYLKAENNMSQSEVQRLVIKLVRIGGCQDIISKLILLTS